MDALRIEAALDGDLESPAGSPQKLPSAVVDSFGEPGPHEAAGRAPAEPFHANGKKSNTLKKYYKKLFKKAKDKDKAGGDSEAAAAACSAAGSDAAGASPGASPQPDEQQQQQQWQSSQQPREELEARAPAAASQGDVSGRGGAAADDGDEATSAAAAAPARSVASPGPGGARYGSGRYDTIGSRGAGGDYGGDEACSVAGLDSRMSTYSSNAGSMSGTIKGFLGPRKKNKKQYELDALRMEMEMLQERCSAAENNLSSASHDVNALRCDRDALQQQLRERTLELTTTRADATKAEEEVARLKTLHSQVKGALQGAYSQNQDLTKQISEVESLCGAQQASLEEAEERYRALADEQDALRHAGLTAKAQLVTAQAQVSELRGARDDLVERAAALEQRLAGARAELEGHVRSAREAAASKASLEVQMEGMLGRLRELEAEKQQLEARQILLQEENLDLGRQVEGLKDEGRGSEARLAALARDNAELAGQLDRALARVEALAADRQRSLAERDGLAAELRSSADMREALRARNDELAAEVVGLRHVASAKKGSPLRWRRGKAAADAPQVSASTEFGPMTKQRVLFTTKAPPPARTASAGSATGQQQQQQLALAGGGVRGATHSGEGEGDVTALVTAAPPGADESHAAACGGSGRLPAPLCSDSPELKGARGPLAAGRTAGGRTAAAAAAEDEAAAGHKDGAEGGEGGRGFMGGLGGLLACFAPPRTARPVAAA